MMNQNTKSHLITCSSFIGILSGACIAFAQVPGVPEDFKSWPVTAILGLVCLVSLGITYFTVRGTFKYMGETADAINSQAEVGAKTHETMKGLLTRMEELCSKYGKLN